MKHVLTRHSTILVMAASIRAHNLQKHACVLKTCHHRNKDTHLLRGTLKPATRALFRSSLGAQLCLELNKNENSGSHRGCYASYDSSCWYFFILIFWKMKKLLLLWYSPLHSVVWWGMRPLLYSPTETQRLRCEGLLMNICMYLQMPCLGYPSSAAWYMVS